MSGAPDRNRGAETERLAVKGLRGLGFPHADRTIRTGHGSARLDLGDVDGTPGVVWQIKSMRPASRAETYVPGWLVETERQRKAASADVGVLVLRRERYLAPHWWAFVPLADLIDLGELERYERIGGPPRRGGLVPVRLELADLCALLCAAGYGETLTA